jgi:hypothetical protein
MARVAPGRTASADEQTTRAIRRTLDTLYAAFSFNINVPDPRAHHAVVALAVPLRAGREGFAMWVVT